MVPIDTQKYFFLSMFSEVKVNQQCLVTKILPNIFYVQYKLTLQENEQFEGE